jgi:hypothetical protein
MAVDDLLGAAVCTGAQVDDERPDRQLCTEGECDVRRRENPSGCHHPGVLRGLLWLCRGATLLLAAALASPASGQTAERVMDPSQVQTTVDVVRRGPRVRLDIGPRFSTAGLPAPPVRLELDEVVNERQDLDIAGVVLMGYDQIFGAPVAGEIFGDFNIDANPDSPVSPYLDDQSALPRWRLYSAFVGLSAGPKQPALQPFFIHLGRMTQLVESPLTYDGAAIGARLRMGRDVAVNAKLWGGLDAPQRLFDDPFSRTSRRVYRETWSLDRTFVSNPGAFEVQRTSLNEPLVQGIGGLVIDGQVKGIGFSIVHAMMPTSTDAFGANLTAMQRSTVGASYRFDDELLTASLGLDTRLTDLVPRQANLRGDVMTADGTTRLGVLARVQFLADTTAYDATFRAQSPTQVFRLDEVNALESLRVRDQIRHLNFAPPQEHVLASVEAERQLPMSWQALVRGRVRHHFDGTDVDMFRTNLYEAGAALSWNPNTAFDTGLEFNLGSVDSGASGDVDSAKDRAFDVVAEGVTSFVEPRMWLRTTLLEGRLRNLTEVFVRRTDVQTRSFRANGQWGSALSTTTTWEVLPTWVLALRIDGDALAPIDGLTASSYLGALVTSSLRLN